MNGLYEYDLSMKSFHKAYRRIWSLSYYFSHSLSVFWIYVHCVQTKNPLFASRISDFYGHIFSDERDFVHELESFEYDCFETVSDYLKKYWSPVQGCRNVTYSPANVFQHIFYMAVWRGK